MRTFSLLTALLLTFSVNAEVNVPAKAEHWNNAERMHFSNYGGREAMTLSGGLFTVKDAAMTNGTIEVDVLKTIKSFSRNTAN